MHVKKNLNFSFLWTFISFSCLISMMTSSRENPTSAESRIVTLAAGALTALYDWKNNWLHLSILTLQAEKMDGMVWIQAVTTAFTL